MDYAYRVEWLPEDNEFVGLVAEFASLSWLAPTSAEAMQASSASSNRLWRIWPMPVTALAEIPH